MDRCSLIYDPTNLVSLTLKEHRDVSREKNQVMGGITGLDWNIVAKKKKRKIHNNKHIQNLAQIIQDIDTTSKRKWQTG